MINKFSITDADWTAISTAGQSGTAWLDEDETGNTGSVDIRITHAATKPTGEPDFTLTKRIFTPRGNTDVLQLRAESGADIFFARAVNSGDSAVLVSDMGA